jgi:hypothetical protein
MPIAPRFRVRADALRQLAADFEISDVADNPSHPFWEDLQHAVLESLEGDKWL